MRTLAITAGTSNARSDHTCTATGTDGHLIDSVVRAAYTLWPRKTAHELAVRQGVSLRTAKYQLARKRNISGANLARLLNSEDGLSFLVAAMGEARPTWWAALIGHIKAVDAERLALKADRQFKEAMNAREQLRETRGRIAALLVQDEEFYSAHLAPVSGQNGAGNGTSSPDRRTMAAPRTKGRGR